MEDFGWKIDMLLLLYSGSQIMVHFYSMEDSLDTLPIRVSLEMILSITQYLI